MIRIAFFSEPKYNDRAKQRRLKMNKADKIFIVLVLLSALLMYVPLFIQDQQNKDKQKEVVVHYQNEEILRVDLLQNHTYQVQATLGEVQIEVKDGAVRVEKETSPYHLCSIQGWVKDTGRPIICLPNELVVQIEAQEPTDDGVDTVIQ